MKYALVVALALIKRNLVTTMISIISVSLALTIPAIFITQYFTILSNLDEYFQMINLDSTYIINIENIHEIDIQKLDLTELNEQLSAIDFVENVYLYSRSDANFIMHNQQFIVGVGIRLIQVTFNINELYNYYPLYQGSWLTTENESVIGRRVANRFGVQIGDQLSVGNDEFIVTGIFDIPTKNEGIWIHYGKSVGRAIWGIRYYIRALENNEQYEDYLATFFSERGLIANVSCANTYISLESRLASGWRILLFLSAVSMVYCILNIAAVQSLHANEQQRNNAIMHALGASRSFILVQEFIRSFIISFVAASITFFILFLLEHFNFLTITEMSVGYQTFLFIFLSSFLLVNIISIYSYIKTRRITISEMLK